jgi:predicted secreted protein
VKKKLIPILCSFIISLLACRCSYKKLEFDSKSGKTNPVKAGDKFRITLSENHEQNYYWSLKQNSNKKSVDYLGSLFHGDKLGEVDFNFEALQVGEAEINFNYYHYNDSTSSVTYRVTVVK